MRDRSSVYLIDDHPIVAAGLRLALEARSDLCLVGVADGPGTGLDEVPVIRPDAVIMDLVFHGRMDMDVIRECRRLLPEAVILVFSSLAPDLYERKCHDAGADGFVCKSEDPRRLAELLCELLAGQARRRPDGRQPDRMVVAAFDGVALTPREAEVAGMLAAGRSVREIAARLDISAKTVAIHRDSLKAKLHCNSSQALTALLARLPEFGAGGR